jgi:xanthine dehydrogenase YagR molybdenum-binding subunit
MFVDGSISIQTGAADLGTGTKTICSQIVSEELNVPMDRIRIEIADTEMTPYASSSGGSMTLPSIGPAMRSAAVKVKDQLLEWGAADLGVPVEDLELAENNVRSKSDPEKTKPIPELIQGNNHLDIVGVGYRGPNPDDVNIKPFGAQFAEVEVNTRTGKVNILRMLGAHDSGRVINRNTYDNQVFGGMTMGIGFGMSEHRIFDRQTGKMVNANMLEYKVPTAKDVPPEHDVLPIDPGDHKCNNISAKGLGEPPTIPTAPAIANAINNAIGVRPTDAPMDPGTIINLIKGKRG